VDVPLERLELNPAVPLAAEECKWRRPIVRGLGRGDHLTPHEVHAGVARSLQTEADYAAVAARLERVQKQGSPGSPILRSAHPHASSEVLRSEEHTSELQS